MSYSTRSVPNYSPACTYLGDVLLTYTLAQSREAILTGNPPPRPRGEE